MHVICPGDIVEIETGITRDREIVTIHRIHTYDSGDMSIRHSYTSTPRRVDWSCFLPKDGHLRLLAHGIGHARAVVHSMLPA